MDVWQLIKSPKLSGSANMQYDLKLFSDFEQGIIPSTLRIYSWKPKCISLGYSQDKERLIDTEMAMKMGWDVVKRPTGGGIVFHNEAEVTYSLVTEIDNPVFPKGLVPSYKKISEAIIVALGKLGVNSEIRHSSFEIRHSQLCFSYPAEYEIVVDGKKLVGSAQKRGKRVLLQQGSIFARKTDPRAFSVLKEEYDDVNAVSLEEILGREVGFNEMGNALEKGFEEKLGIGFMLDLDKLQASNHK